MKQISCKLLSLLYYCPSHHYHLNGLNSKELNDNDGNKSCCFSNYFMYYIFKSSWLFLLTLLSAELCLSPEA